MSFADVTIIIPTLNEENNIGQLIKLISYSYNKIRIIVVDDGSKDATWDIVRSALVFDERLQFLDRSKKKVHGITASVMDACSSVESKYFVVMDGDLQHPYQAIREIVAKLRSGSDIVIGTRRKVIGRWPLHRKLVSITATRLARIRLMQHPDIKDPMSGFFGVRTTLFRKVLSTDGWKFEKRGYKVLFDLLKYVTNVRVAQVYYNFGTRKGGQSKIRMRHIAILLRSLFK